MAAAQTFKIKTNIPLTGSIGSIYFSEATGQAAAKGWGDNICVYGDWNEGKGKVYLPLWCWERFQELGIITGDKDGDGRYPVKAGQSVTIVRTEQGNKKITSIDLGTSESLPTPTPQGSVAAPQSAQTSPDVRRGWKVLQHRFMASYLTARKILPEGTPPEVVQSATACVFIEANKQGLAPPEITDE